MKCERHVNKKPCGAPAVAFAMGQSLCAVHDPTGDPNCTHSLNTNGRCSYCGARTEGHD